MPNFSQFRLSLICLPSKKVAQGRPLILYASLPPAWGIVRRFNTATLFLVYKLACAHNHYRYIPVTK